MSNSFKRSVLNVVRSLGFEIAKVPLRAHESRSQRFVANAKRATGYLMRSTGYVVFRLGKPDKSQPLAGSESGPQPTPTQGAGAVVKMTAHDRTISHGRTNDLAAYVDALVGVTPWKGDVPKGFLVDFLGTLTDANFRSMWGADPASAGGQYLETALPTLSNDGEGWFEAVDCATAARNATGRFVMVMLGANYGRQVVGGYRTLMQVNPLPCKLVAVEGEPGNFGWMANHFQDNGIEPEDHWLIHAAVSATNAPLLFPVGGSGTGMGNCAWLNEPRQRQRWVKELIYTGFADDALENLIVNNTTGLVKQFSAESPETFEIQYVSAVTLDHILAPFERVDYLESDIQHSEVIVFPPAMEQLRRKVRRVHIGTHSVEGHRQLQCLFENRGWNIVFSYEPMTEHVTPLGKFSANDGILTVANPDLEPV